MPKKNPWRTLSSEAFTTKGTPGLLNRYQRSYTPSIVQKKKQKNYKNIRTKKINTQKTLRSNKLGGKVTRRIKRKGKKNKRKTRKSTKK